MKTKHTLLMLSTAMILLIGCGEDNKSPETATDPVVNVTVESVKPFNTMSPLIASGKIEAVHSANMSTRMTGYVDKISVSVGDRVKKGQHLISLENADLSAKLARSNAGIKEATAALDNARKDYERFLALFKENSASQKELDDITANYKMAQARLESAEQLKNEVNAQLHYVNIRAPFNGVVTNKFIKVGDLASPGMPLLELESPEKFQVIALVPESEIAHINAGTEVQVMLKSLHTAVSGTVAEVSTSAKNTGGQFRVKVALKASAVEVMTGMYVSVHFPKIQEETTSTVRIPSDVIVKNGQLRGVYTVSQRNTAVLRWLRLGNTYNGQVEVLSGLTQDETYVRTSEGKLYNGVKINMQ